MYGVEVRPAGIRDIEPICRFLSASSSRSATFWRSLLAYPWLADEEKPDRGVVIASGDQVFGFFGAIYSDRYVAGRRQRICNTFAWYVHPDYRRYTVSLLGLLVKRPDLAYVNVTPADHVIPILKRIGFRLADEERFVCMPTWLRAISESRRMRIVPEDEVSEELIGKEAFRIYQDHWASKLQQRVFERGGEACLILSKRVYWTGVRFPRTDLYYVSRPDFFARHFDAVLFQLFRCDKTMGLIVDPRSVDGRPARATAFPANAFYPSATLVKPGDVPVSAIDRLYTELVILP